MNWITDWTWLAAGLGVLAADLVLIYIAWRALFGDKANGRRRCPRCWYDLAYAPSMSCAECGFTARRESQFHRTRRRWSTGILAIVLSAAVVIAAIHQVGSGNVFGMLPTRVLLWTVPVVGGPRSPIHRELFNRARQGTLTHEQWTALLTRFAAGDWTNRPPDDGWIEKYGNTLAAWRGTISGDQKLEGILLGIEARVEVSARETWPADTPMVATMRVRDWWPAGLERRVVITPDVPGTEPTTIHLAPMDRGQLGSIPLTLPPLPSGVTSIHLTIAVERRAPRPLADSTTIESQAASSEADGWERAFERTFLLSTRIEGSLAQAMQPADDPTMAQIIERVFSQGVVQWSGGGRSPVRFRIDAPQTFQPPFDDTAVGVRVELLHDGTLARQLNLWWLGGSKLNPTGQAQDTSSAGFAGFAGRNYGFEVAFERPSLLTRPQDQGRWSLRITGDPSLALRAGTVPNYWAGQVTIPLDRLTVQSGQAPQRPWWTSEEARSAESGPSVQ